MYESFYISTNLVRGLSIKRLATLSMSKRMLTSTVLMLLLTWLAMVPCYASLVVTVGQGAGYDYSDFQDAIDYVLSVTNEEEAAIKLAGGDYISEDGYQIPIGTSQIQSIRIEPISSNDEVRLVGHQTPVINCDSILKVIGNNMEDKTVEIANVSVEYSAYTNSNGVTFNRGFKSITVSGCRFDDIIRAVNIYVSGVGNDVGIIKNLNILDNTFTPKIQYNSSHSVFTKIDIRSSQCQDQLQCLYRIAGNHTTGTIGKHLDVRFPNQVPFVPCILIENNVFRTEALASGGVVSAHGADADINLTYGCSESSYTPPIIRNNSFVNSKIRLTNISADISGNRFFETFDRLMREHIYLMVSIGSNQSNYNKKATIKNNIFQGDVVSAVVLFPRAPHGARYSAQLVNNSFKNLENIIEIETESLDNSGPMIIPRFVNNLCQVENTVNVFYTDIFGQPEVIQLSEPILAQNCHFENDPGDETYQNIVLDECTIGDPQINLGENGEYTIIWNETVKSPLINAGCPEIDGEPQYDPDGTPPDIGAVYYPHHSRTYFSDVSPSNIYWLSFPVVDDRTNTNGSLYWNELGQMFNEYMQWPSFNLNNISWSYDLDAATMYHQNSIWLEEGHLVGQPKGYKVQFASGIHPDELTINGFKVDPSNTPVEWVVSVEQNGQQQPFRNWIGYFVPNTYRAGDALSRYLPGSTRVKYLDYVHTIITQYWSTQRINKEMGSPWVINPNTYTLSEGAMVELQLLPGAPEEMFWNTNLPQTPPITRDQSKAFEYEEKLDYSTVFISFDADEMPTEVGLYVNGECKGAAVVDSTLIDVCLYTDDAKDGGELEIVFYHEGKGKKAVQGWKTYNHDSMVFEDTGLRTDQIGRFAYLSFSNKEGDSPVPLITQLDQNYPNPFNPETNISFVLANDMQAKLDIYNIRGQKITTLFSGEMTKGKHTLQWNGVDAQGRKVASGIYFSRLQTPEGSFSQKMMLMK